MQKRPILLLLILLLYDGLYAQPVIRFDSTRYSVGRVDERIGILEVIAPFRNAGNRPLLIHRVRDGGGVGVAEAFGGTPAKPVSRPERPAPSGNDLVILPGKRGFIRYHYPTQGRPGPFQKGFIVYSNISDSTDEPARVVVEGEVIPAGKGEVIQHDGLR